MVDYSLIKNIACGIKKYVEKQEILHLSFMRAHSDLVKLSNIEFLPRSGFVFDEEMNKWEFKKHGCGYEFSHEGTIIDINDYFLSNADFLAQIDYFSILNRLNLISKTKMQTMRLNLP
ncbi:DUF6896 domain-containing protein [Delftia acidovorans]|uniref:DUF6896 domain-containing protein n=1 Tax=Delftia acidovorans TaxID=80866 RepID=UPI003017A866